MLDFENSFVTKFLQEYQNYIHDEHHLYNFKSDKSKGLLLQAEQDYINRILDTSKPLEEIPLVMQRSFNIYNLYAHYAIEVLDDETLFLENIAIAGEYAEAHPCE